MVAISDVTWDVKNVSGLDNPELVNHSTENCGIKGFDGDDAVNLTSLLTEECDVLILVPLGGVINKQSSSSSLKFTSSLTECVHRSQMMVLILLGVKQLNK